MEYVLEWNGPVAGGKVLARGPLSPQASNTMISTPVLRFFGI